MASPDYCITLLKISFFPHPSENNYQEEKCIDVLESMRQCCIKWKSESFVCEGIDINKTYVTQKEESKDSKSKK